MNRYNYTKIWSRAGVYFLLLVLLCSFSYIHPFYVSVTEVSIDTGMKKMDISCKVFTNDLENALKQLYKESIDLKNTKDEKKAEELLKKYFSSHFSVQTGGEIQQPAYVGYEIEEEAIWIYFEVNDYTAKGKIEITNTLLYDFLPAQNNLIHCIYNGTRKSTRLVNPDQKAEFSF